jgi:glycosyltransferase involved in cell wall biosynthesis
LERIVIFIEESSNISKLLSSITNIIPTKIISCDILSHEKLLEMNIDHQMIENYIDKNDQDLINKLIISNSHDWYRQKGIAELLEFENMNLGSLLELEIGPYFLQIMKNFIGVKRVIDKENPSSILCPTSLSMMAKIFTIDKKIKVKSYGTSNSTSLTYDKIQISFNIGKKLFTLWVSRKFALKIKHTLELLTNFFFKLKFNFSKPSTLKSIILLDFNPVLHGGFLKELKRLDQNIILLNQRRPAVWNLQSLRNVKQSNSKIIQLEDLLNPKLSSIIMQKQKQLQNSLLKMSKDDDSLMEFFSIENYSFWPCIKNTFIEMCSKRFNEIIKKSVLSKELIKKINISCMLVLYDTGLEEKIFTNVANEFKIPGIVLQHGAYTKRDTGIIAPILSFIPSNRLIHGLWGHETENIFRQVGVKDEDMLIVGSPRYDELFRIKNKCKNKNTILFGSSILSELEYSRIDTNMIIKFKNIFTEICKISSNIPNKKLIVKLHPGQYLSYDVRPLLKELDPSIPIYKTKNIVDLIKDCDVFVYIDFSTALLEAMILNKPTITFKIFPDSYYTDNFFQSGATLLVSTIDEFKEALNSILFNEKFRNNLIQKAANYVKDSFTNQENSSEFLINILKKY